MKAVPRWAKLVAGLLLAVCVIVSTLLALRWPYTQKRMTTSIERATGSRVQLKDYRLVFFPEPGCTIGDLTLRRHSNEPLAQARRLTIRSSWLSLLTFQKRVGRVKAEGLQFHIPTPVPPPIQTGSPGGLGKFVIGEFMADGTAIVVPSNHPSPKRFTIHELRLKEVGTNKQLTYATVLDIPDPPGRLQSSGAIGPFTSGKRESVLVSGSFELTGADLGKYKGVAGTVNGKGTFHGALENVRVTGTAAASAFEVNRSGHPVDLRTSYKADVNGISGDVVLHDIDANFLQTRLFVNGAVEGRNGKTVSLDFQGKDGRVEDLLSMFTRSDKPALQGPIDLRAAVRLEPGDKPFLRRVNLNGSFGITDAKWGKPNTQIKVNRLSARARGDKKQVEERAGSNVDHVLSKLKGDVSLSEGLASLSNVTFQVPGAKAGGGGTYNLISKRVDLKGVVSMAADASEATSGFKSVLLKPFDRLFRRNKKQGATLPVSITGEYPRPEYKVGLRK
jgi:hypothetical protein